MNLRDRVKGILLKPGMEWQVISGETTGIQELYKTYVMILAAIGPAASIIGMSMIGIRVPLAGSFHMPFFTSFSSALVNYILTLVGVYILALIIDALAPTFSGQKNKNQAFKLAAYSYTPGWLCGIFWLIPTLSPLGILGLYGLYLLYLGIPVLMKSPPEKTLGYTVSVIVAAVVLFMLIGFISQAFLSYPVPVR